MRANKYTGEVDVMIGKRKCVLVFDFEAIAALHTVYESDLKGGLLDVGKITDLKKLAAIMAVGLQKHQLGITAAEVMAAPPPLVTMRRAMDTAIAYTYFGPDIMAEIEKGTERLANAKTVVAKKKKS